MAQYSTTFSEYSAGSPPSDWTAQWTTSNVTYNVVADAIGDGGNILRVTSTADARRALSWDDIDADANRDNVEVLCRFRMDSVASGVDDSVRIHVRGSGAVGSEDGYFIRIPTAVSTSWALNKYVAGVSTALGSAVAFTFVANALYNTRFRVNGTSLRAKLWKDGTDEPAGWQVDVTDSSLATAGWVGVGRFDATPTVDITHFIAATNGDTASWPAAVDTIGRVTQAPIEVVSNANANVVVTQLSLDVVNVGVSNARITQLSLEVVTPNETVFTLQVTEVGDTVAASIQHPTTAALTVTEAADTIAVSYQLLSYIVILTSLAEAGDRITAVGDLEIGWWLEVGPVVTGGTIIDVVVNQDGTFEVAASVTSFEVRASEDAGETWGAYGTQYIFDPLFVELAVTEGSDTLSASTGLVVIASLAVTEGSDTFAADIGLVVTMSLAVTEGSDGIAADTDLVLESSAMFLVF